MGGDYKYMKGGERNPQFRGVEKRGISPREEYLERSLLNSRTKV